MFLGSERRGFSLYNFLAPNNDRHFYEFAVLEFVYVGFDSSSALPFASKIERASYKVSLYPTYIIYSHRTNLKMRLPHFCFLLKVSRDFFSKKDFPFSIIMALALFSLPLRRLLLDHIIQSKRFDIIPKLVTPLLQEPYVGFERRIDRQ